MNTITGIMSSEQSGWFIIFLPVFAAIYGLYLRWYLQHIDSGG